MTQKRPEVENIGELYDVYGEPCSNCIYGEWQCDKGHRRKKVGVNYGHIPYVFVRRRGGCPDHEIKSGDWWGEDPVRPFSSVYGGTKTDVIC